MALARAAAPGAAMTKTLNSPLLTTLLLCAATAGSALAAAETPEGANEAQLLRLATCQDSWLEWKAEPGRLQRFATDLHRRYTLKPKSPAMTPNAPAKLLGFPVQQLFPDSVGMGVGFSVQVQADFKQARQRFEEQLGRPLQCEGGDGMLSCELPLGEKKTALLVKADSGPSKSTLLGCYYFYQQ